MILKDALMKCFGRIGLVTDDKHRADAYARGAREGRILSVLPLSLLDSQFRMSLEKPVMSSLALYFQANRAYPSLTKDARGKINYFEMTALKPAVWINRDGKTATLVMPIYNDEHYGDKLVFSKKYAEFTLPVADLCAAVEKRLMENYTALGYYETSPNLLKDGQPLRMALAERAALEETRGTLKRLCGAVPKDPAVEDTRKIYAGGFKEMDVETVFARAAQSRETALRNGGRTLADNDMFQSEDGRFHDHAEMLMLRTRLVRSILN